MRNVKFDVNVLFFAMVWCSVMIVPCVALVLIIAVSVLLRYSVYVVVCYY